MLKVDTTEDQPKTAGSSAVLLEEKLASLLRGVALKDIPLDYIGTTYFGDTYKRKEILGTGSFGIVVKVLDIVSVTDYAMKVRKSHFIAD